MKKKLVITICGVLLIAIISAGLLPYISNSVTGSVEVSGPVFYTGASNSLKLVATSNSGPSINNYGEQVFRTEELGEIDFNYIFDISMYIRANVNSPNQNLTLTFGYNDGTDNVLCTKNITVNSSLLENYGSEFCTGISAPQNVHNFYYKINGNCDSCTYNLSHGLTGFHSRVEISKSP